MNNFVQGFLDNDSYFGKFMTKVGIIIGANLMFVLCSIPFFTIGPGLVALYHVMLKTLRGDGVLNPFTEFFIGFKNNFKQGLISWIIFALIGGFLAVDLQICKQAGGSLTFVKYGVYGVIVILVISFVFLLPTMAAFADSIPHLIRNGWFFAVRKPIPTLVILFFNVFPFVLTYTDKQNMPLWAFLWCMFGFGAVAMLTSTLLIGQFNEFLPGDEAAEYENLSEDEKKVLEDMKKLDGV